MGLDEQVDVVDAREWFDLFEERFGIPTEVFDDYAVFRPNKKALNIVAGDHEPPPAPVPDAIGVRFIRTKMRFPKMTTAAAMMFGNHATRNVLSLSQSEADCYLSRTTVELTETQLEHCTGTGYVIVTHRDVTLGVGLLFRDDAGGRLRSMYPKAWALPDGESAF